MGETSTDIHLKKSNVPLTDMHFVDLNKVCCISGRWQK